MMRCAICISCTTRMLKRDLPTNHAVNFNNNLNNFQIDVDLLMFLKGYLPGERELSWFPADSDVPLPPNPVLEDYALHGKNKKHNNKNHDAVIADQVDHTSSIISNQPIDLVYIFRLNVILIMRRFKVVFTLL